MNTLLESDPQGTVAPGRPRPAHKVIITGTGRAGTTFLVQLLTALGEDTGYDPQDGRTDYFPHCAAGLEHDLADANAPYIVKNPELCVTLEAILAEGKVAIDHAIIPVRDLESATLSRVRIGGPDGDIPGGLVGTSDPAQQRSVLAERFHRLVQTLIAHDIPYTFLLFPRFVTDANYAFQKLSDALPWLDRARFMTVFPTIANPQLVHDFARQPAAPSMAAIRYQAEQRAKQKRRRRRRIAWQLAAAIALVGAIGLGWRSVNRATSHSASPPTASAPILEQPRVHLRPFTYSIRFDRPRGLRWARGPRLGTRLDLSHVAVPAFHDFVSPAGAPESRSLLAAWSTATLTIEPAAVFAPEASR